MSLGVRCHKGQLIMTIYKSFASKLCTTRAMGVSTTRLMCLCWVVFSADGKILSNFEEFQNVCFDWYGGVKSEHLVVLGSASRERLWIHPTTNTTTEKRRLWVNVPTLLLTAPNTNPAHQFWDVIVNLFELDGQTPPFTHWNGPSFDAGNWISGLVPKLFDVLNIRLRTIHEFITNEQVLCFTSAWVPMFGIYRTEKRPIPNETPILRRLHEALVDSFHAPARTVVVYGKQDLGHSGRQWRNAAEVAKKLNVTGDVQYIKSMAALSFKEQCHLVWSARHLVFVHGGHSANLICARPETRVDEMACPAWVGWLQDIPMFHASLGLRYQYHSVPGCNGHNAAFTTQMGWLAHFVRL
jgi:hypothetical protein